MKELIGKVKINNSSLPFKIITDKTEILGETNIANEFNNFFTDIGLVNLLSKFQNHQKLLKVIWRMLAQKWKINLFLSMN